MEMGRRSPRAPSAPPRAPQPVAPAPVDPHLCGHCCDALDRDPGRRCDPWPAGQSQSPCSMRVEASLFRLGCLSLSPLVEAHPGNYAVHLQLHQLTSLTSTKLPQLPRLPCKLRCLADSSTTRGPVRITEVCTSGNGNLSSLGRPHHDQDVLRVDRLTQIPCIADEPARWETKHGSFEACFRCEQ